MSYIMCYLGWVIVKADENRETGQGVLVAGNNITGHSILKV